MKGLKLRELLEGCDDIIIPPELDTEAYTEAMPFSHEAPIGALLFLTDKIGMDEGAIDASNLREKPLAIVASHTRTLINSPCPIIRSGNVRLALSYALSQQCGIDYGKIKIIGITGTNGKTTTATLIYEILRRCGYKVGFIGTGKIISDREVLSGESYSMTTPDPTLLFHSIAKMVDDGCTYLVMEVSSHSIALGKVAPIRFEYAIFTNLDNDHLDFHENMEDYFYTKLKLFSSAKRGLFNIDDEYGRRAMKLAECEKASFGIVTKGDAYATEIHTDELNKISFFYRQPELIFKAHVNIGGAFNVYNSLAALRCVIDLGIKPCIAKEALSRVFGVEGRMELINADVRAVIDYAHTPAAFYNTLKTLKSYVKNGQKLTVVFGCGGNRDRYKRPVFGKYADLFADCIIITEDNSRNEDFDQIVSDIIAGISNKDYKIIKDRESAIRTAVKNASRGDLIALIGKGHERYKIVGSEYLPFDERAIIKDALKEAGLLYES